MENQFTVIKGKFTIFYPDYPKQGPEPDGDTLKFIPSDPELVESLPKRGDKKAQIRQERVNVRLEGIDALETHFEGTHQNLGAAYAARNELLQAAGFGRITFWEDMPHKIKEVEHNPIPGFVLSNGVDSRGRVLGFVFDGDTHHADGENITLNHILLEQSFNLKLLRSGFAYPHIYRSLTWDLCMLIQKYTKQARADGRGLWTKEVGHPGGEFFQPSPENITQVNLWPKLFRRLASFFGSGETQLAEFSSWLEKNPDKNDLLLLPNGETVYFRQILDIHPKGLRMLYYPEDLIILK